jgi:hypothetical protein
MTSWQWNKYWGSFPSSTGVLISSTLYGFCITTDSKLRSAVTLVCCYLWNKTKWEVPHLILQHRSFVIMKLLGCILVYHVTVITTTKLHYICISAQGRYDIWRDRTRCATKGSSLKSWMRHELTQSFLHVHQNSTVFTHGPKSNVFLSVTGKERVLVLEYWTGYWPGVEEC